MNQSTLQLPDLVKSEFVSRKSSGKNNWFQEIIGFKGVELLFTNKLLQLVGYTLSSVGADRAEIKTLVQIYQDVLEPIILATRSPAQNKNYFRQFIQCFSTRASLIGISQSILPLRRCLIDVSCSPSSCSLRTLALSRI